MNTAALLALLQSIIVAFFSKNPTAEEISVVLPQLAAAFSGAKAGEPFNVSVALDVDGKAGTFTAGWTPNA